MKRSFRPMMSVKCRCGKQVAIPNGTRKSYPVVCSCGAKHYFDDEPIMEVPRTLLTDWTA